MGSRVVLFDSRGFLCSVWGARVLSSIVPPLGGRPPWPWKIVWSGCLLYYVGYRGGKVSTVSHLAAALVPRGISSLWWVEDKRPSP